MIFKKDDPIAALDAELHDLGGAIRRLEISQLEAKSKLSAAIDERERLLAADTATIEDFAQPNRDRDAATLAIERAERALPKLRRQEEKLLAARRALRAEVFRAELAGAAGKIEQALRSLIAANAAAAEILVRASRELTPVHFHLDEVQFRGLPRVEALTMWRAYIDLNLLAKRPPSAPMPGPRAAKPPLIVPPPDAAGNLKILFLRRHQKFQPGDISSLPAKEAERLCIGGAAEFLEPALEGAAA